MKVLFVISSTAVLWATIICFHTKHFTKSSDQEQLEFYSRGDCASAINILCELALCKSPKETNGGMQKYTLETPLRATIEPHMREIKLVRAELDPSAQTLFFLTSDKDAFPFLVVADIRDCDSLEKCVQLMGEPISGDAYKHFEFDASFNPLPCFKVKRWWEVVVMNERGDLELLSLSFNFTFREDQKESIDNIEISPNKLVELN